MRVAALLAALWALGCSTWLATGSLYRSPCVHVGARPASDGLGDGAVTVQVSTDWPACRQVYGGRR